MTLLYCDISRFKKDAIMQDLKFDWLDGDCDLNYGTPVLPSPDSLGVGPAAERVSLMNKQTDQPSGERLLPLLRLSNWESNKRYDKANPECIHYDFR